MSTSGRSQENVRTPEQDGGRPGWVAVLVLFITGLFWSGVTKGFGIMLPTVQEQLDTQTWTVGWIASAVAAASGLVCKYY